VPSRRLDLAARSPFARTQPPRRPPGNRCSTTLENDPARPGRQPRRPKRDPQPHGRERLESPRKGARSLGKVQGMTLGRIPPIGLPSNPAIHSFQNRPARAVACPRLLPCVRERTYRGILMPKLLPGIVACTGAVVIASENSSPEAALVLKLQTEGGQEV